jgi:hypothetical protein
MEDDPFEALQQLLRSRSPPPLRLSSRPPGSSSADPIVIEDDDEPPPSPPLRSPQILYDPISQLYNNPGLKSSHPQFAVDSFLTPALRVTPPPPPSPPSPPALDLHLASSSSSSSVAPPPPRILASDQPRLVDLLAPVVLRAVLDDPLHPQLLTVIQHFDAHSKHSRRFLDELESLLPSTASISRASEAETQNATDRQLIEAAWQTKQRKTKLAFIQDLPFFVWEVQTGLWRQPKPNKPSALIRQATWKYLLEDESGDHLELLHAHLASRIPPSARYHAILLLSQAHEQLTSDNKLKINLPAIDQALKGIELRNPRYIQLMDEAWKPNEGVTLRLVADDIRREDMKDMWRSVMARTPFGKAILDTLVQDLLPLFPRASFDMDRFNDDIPIQPRPKATIPAELKFQVLKLIRVGFFEVPIPDADPRSRSPIVSVKSEEPPPKRARVPRSFTSQTSGDQRHLTTTTTRLFMGFSYASAILCC